MSSNLTLLIEYNIQNLVVTKYFRLEFCQKARFSTLVRTNSIVLSRKSLKLTASYEVWMHYSVNVRVIF